MFRALKNILLGSLLAIPLSAQAVSQDELSIGITAEFENLHPVISTMGATKYMMYMAWRPVIKMSIDGKLEPVLIKKIPTLENKLAKKIGESLETHIEIIDKATWGDGTPVTCKDLHFGWQLGINKNVSVGNREQYENISEITWDPKTPKKCMVKFAKARYTYTQEYPDYAPAHLEESIFKQYGGKSEGYDHNSLYTTQPTNPGLYDGPYVISEVKLGSHLIYTPNPHFYGKKPYFKKIIIKIIPNSNTLEANLKSGTIHIIASPGGFGFDQALAFEKKIKEEKLPYKQLFQDGSVYVHIDLNLANPALSELNVRRAITHAINKKEMIDSLLGGKVKQAIHFATTIDPWYTSDVKTYDYNRKEASRLLDEAGWKMGPKGYREKNGKTLTLNLRASAGLKLIENQQAYIQAQLKAVGIEVQIKNEPQRVFFSETTQKRKFDMALFSWISNPELSPRSVVHSSMIPSEKNSWAGQDYTGYNNPEMDKLVDQLENEFSLAKRKQLAKKILQLYANDIFVIPLYYRPTNTVVPQEMKNFVLSGHQFYETLNVENWSL